MFSEEGEREMGDGDMGIIILGVFWCLSWYGAQHCKKLQR